MSGRKSPEFANFPRSLERLCNVEDSPWLHQQVCSILWLLSSPIYTSLLLIGRIAAVSKSATECSLLEIEMPWSTFSSPSSTKLAQRWRVSLLTRPPLHRCPRSLPVHPQQSQFEDALVVMGAASSIRTKKLKTLNSIRNSANLLMTPLKAMIRK